MKDFSIPQKHIKTSEQIIDIILGRQEQYYVYVLVNPINSLPFYVGKGQGYRILKHWENRNSCNRNVYKNRFLNKLHKKGLEPLYTIHSFCITEEIAYEKEAMLIKKYGLKHRSKNNLLYNIKFGQGKEAISYQQPDIIRQCIETHGDRYDYSLVKYIGAHDDIEVICKKHGSFWQNPMTHISGRNCNLCSGGVQHTTEDFINKSKEVHGDEYIYNKTIYVNNMDKLIVVCRKHGPFSIRPAHHKNGTGCSECAKSKRTGRPKGSKNSHWDNDCNDLLGLVLKRIRNKD